MRNTTAITLALAAAVLLASCSKSPSDEGAKRTNRVVEAPRSAATGSVGQAAPDASRHTVLVVAPPSAPLLVQKQQAKLEADREVTETQIHGLMDHYSDNMRNPAEKAKYQEQISQQLDAYKRQTLQLYKLQQAAAKANSGTNAPAKN
jgi:hypothetical protein